ncbi:hypothetical protein FSP39_017008 [Pinctada imbricata]|uniref:RNA-directed DNA polymerase from transposon X-element n=1 Tax=Pinctada imbricata TaxID=66713 RepID=A0AA88YDL2_PINIB|nr:hypothetical protein FSP39_017008 [Pinctada imbricata]
MLETSNFSVINRGEITRIDNRTESAIDLTIVSNSLSGQAEWEVIQEPCGSDHLPILTTLNFSPEIEEIKLPKKFIFEKADWSEYKTLLKDHKLDEFDSTTVNTLVNDITNKILNAAGSSIPKTSGKTKRRTANPSWSGRCTEARKTARRAFRDFRNNKITHTEYNRIHKNTKKVIKEVKQEHWREYVSTLNKNTNTAKVWKKINTLNGSKKSNIPTIGNAYAAKDKAELFAKQFASASSSNNLEHDHKTKRAKFINKHKNALNDLGPDTGPLNTPISVKEIKEALNSKADTAPGDDKVTYKLLKNLPENMLSIIATLMNQIFSTGQFPTEWRNAVVIPLPKPGKDPNDPQSYRPISLTSHLCKTMETVLNNRLRWYLEKKGIIDPAQSGFRSNRSTLDHLVTLETEIKCGIASKQYTGAVFLDISKAFDLVWHEGLIYKTKNYGITGKFLNFIKNFLTDRKIQVKVNENLSDTYDLENGTPQGSVISPTLFNIMVNDLAEVINSGEDDAADTPTLSQFADDNKLSHTDRTAKRISKNLQKYLNKITSWSTKWGFKISKEKTVAILFGRNTTKYDKEKSNFKLFIQNEPIKVVKSAKFLGVTFDQHLTFKQHFDNISDSCKKALNIMRCVSGSTFGSDKLTLLMLYKSLIRSKIDYGSPALLSACKSQIEIFDRIQSAALRIALRAHASTPIPALLAEAGELPVSVRWEELALKYWARVLSNPDNPANDLMNHRFTRIYNFPSYHTRWDLTDKGPFGYRMYKAFQMNEFKDLTIAPVEACPHPPWLLTTPTISTDINIEVSKQDLPAKVKAVALETIDQKYQGQVKVFTDGSKDPQSGKTAAAFYDTEAQEGCSYRCTDNISIFTAELIAIREAVDQIKHKNYKQAVILSDSLSALQALQNKSGNRPDILHEILQEIHILAARGVGIRFEWVPAHVGIQGNEAADQLAKDALNNEIIECDTGLSSREIYPIARRIIVNSWEENYSQLGLHINKIKTSATSKPNKYSKNIREDAVVTRLRLGRTKLCGDLGQHIGESGPNCKHCNIPETIEHYLFNCSRHSLYRQDYIARIKALNIQDFTLRSLLNPPKYLAHDVFNALITYVRDTDYLDKI